MTAFREIMGNIRAVDIRQEEGEVGTDDYDFLNDLDMRFSAVLDGTDTPAVVDIHTDPASGFVLEEAVGIPLAVEYKGLKGTRSTCYEFKQPIGERLTDEEWKEMVAEKKPVRSVTQILMDK